MSYLTIIIIINISFSGGLASVIYTDTLQTVVLIGGAIVVTSMCKDMSSFLMNSSIGFDIFIS